MQYSRLLLLPQLPRPTQLGRTPHLTLLSPTFYKRALMPLLGQWLALFMARHKLGRHMSDQQAYEYMVERKSLPANAWRLLSDRQVKLLNLGAEWLGALL